MKSDVSRGAYWSSRISAVTPEKVFIRGYDLEDLIGDLPFTAAIYLLIKGDLPSPPEVRVLDGVLSAVLDYGLEKPGTVAARFAVSANPSMAVGLAAACLSVGRHTLATEDTSRFIVDCYSRFQESGSTMEEFADQEVARLRTSGHRIPGLGHPVFKRVDPRAAALRALAVRESCWPAAADLYEALHSSFTRLPGKEDIAINDVGMMAAVLVGLGFSPEEGTGVAILSTMPGLIAHISEELTGGRPIRVVPRDEVAYDVQSGRDYRRDRARAGWTDDWGAGAAPAEQS
ncbi:citryl-CoA lyase [Nocardioides pocheonensis]|uniref:citrate synthase (unknown stereospecificity) n=1 Tax=Nocardioides pocheonensis TaxID=661485 RepID=A0A3N0GSF0_9ACTN|nr:citryl-CoA lyase [Nocardioides pocheonensis]RNM15116.1 citryl-CoA lyase [Nocardioides pocheonensis]